MSTPKAAPVPRLLELMLGQTVSHALVLLDPSGLIVDWRRGAERLFGYRSDEVIGKPDAILFVPEDVARGLNVQERQIAEASGESEDDRWQLRKDGGRIWVSGAMTALREGDGTLAGFAKIMRDRTDVKAQIEAMESRVAAAQHAEGQRIQFVATLAHELRNPLGTISNAVAVLQDPRVTPSQMQFAAASVRRQADFMTRMVSDLLEVARTAVGKTQLHRERVVLQDIVNLGLEAVRGSLEQRMHTVHKLLPPVPIELHADPTRLRQVFVNLLDNAAKYTPARGTIWIKVTIEAEEAVVRVRDTGVGISPKVMPDIFELFTQGEAAGAAQGLGIGLALVKETVALHGGTVQVTSDGVGQGSEFTVRLPMLQGPHGTPRAPE